MFNMTVMSANYGRGPLKGGSAILHNGEVSQCPSTLLQPFYHFPAVGPGPVLGGCHRQPSRRRLFTGSALKTTLFPQPLKQYYNTTGGYPRLLVADVPYDPARSHPSRSASTTPVPAAPSRAAPASMSSRVMLDAWLDVKQSGAGIPLPVHLKKVRLAVHPCCFGLWS
jgi:hypothetical protein